MTELNQQQLPFEPIDDLDIESEIEPYEHIKERLLYNLTIMQCVHLLI